MGKKRKKCKLKGESLADDEVMEGLWIIEELLIHNYQTSELEAKEQLNIKYEEDRDYKDDRERRNSTSRRRESESSSSYLQKPSLQHMTLVKVVITLWNQDDIRALRAQFYFPILGSERQEKWQEIEDKVVEKVPKLLLPEPLKEKILNFIKPIGIQILKWMEYHHNNLYLYIKLPNYFCWTPQGTIDKKKTAEISIQDESLDITRRYKLACIYCLENDIPKLWNKMPENCRESFYSEEDPRKVRQQEFVVLWTYDIKEELAKMDNLIERRWKRKCSPYQFAFEYAAVAGNEAANKYFIQKLTSKEREESLVRSAGYVAEKRIYSDHKFTDLPKEHYTDALCFLLSQMNEEQQMEVLKNNPYEVLKCLLDWPWQSYFMETANRMWDFLSEEDYKRLLSMIINKVIDGHKDCNYQELFGKFWQQSSNAHKRYVIDKCVGEILLLKLFKIKDEKNIRLILKDATPLEKRKLIFYLIGKKICRNLIYGDEWDLLELFIRECISSKKEMIKFKQEFKEPLRCSKEYKKKKDNWDKFFQLLDDFINRYNKNKSIVDGESSSAKKL